MFGAPTPGGVGFGAGFGPGPLPRLAVALEAPGLEPLEPLLDALEDLPVLAAVGPALLAAVGPTVVHHLRHSGLEAALDLRLACAPHAAGLIAEVAARARVRALTVQLDAGEAVVAAALRGARGRVPIVGVLAPTWRPAAPGLSAAARDDQIAAADALARRLRLAGVAGTPAQLALAQHSGLRWAIGVREPGEPHDEHAAPGSVAEALAANASTLVIGRPILRAADPAAAARALIARLAPPAEAS